MSITFSFDCGGTYTRAGLYGVDHALLKEATGGPGNVRELGVEGVVAVLADLCGEWLAEHGAPGRVAVGMAGAATQELRETIAFRLGEVLGANQVLVADDRLPLLVANAGSGPGLVVVAGTGSSLLARASTGDFVALGGRGSLIGDAGSAYHLAVRALRFCARSEDGLAPETELVSAMTRRAGLEDFTELPAWASSARREEIAGLARAVTHCASAGDDPALECLVKEAALLADQTRRAFSTAGLTPETPVILGGGLFLAADLYRRIFEQALEGLSTKTARLVEHGAVLEMALHPEGLPVACFERSAGQTVGRLPTEDKLAVPETIDQLDALEIVRLMNREESRVSEALARKEGVIAEAVQRAAGAFVRGGRLIYLGAGTSGRLGVLDASECPPTFGLDPSKVQALLAGGPAAMTRSVEGAEDDGPQGGRDLQALDPAPGPADLVVGITASGSTPYVLGALEAAQACGADTVLVTCNPGAQRVAGLTVAIDTGPEVLTGSTRLKAGTASKRLLNMLSTGAMALSGQIFEGLMVGMVPGNVKLRGRARGIVATLAGVDEAAAEALLERAGNRIPLAVLLGCCSLTLDEARARLEAAGGSLAKALRKEN